MSRSRAFFQLYRRGEGNSVCSVNLVFFLSDMEVGTPTPVEEKRSLDETSIHLEEDESTIKEADHIALVGKIISDKPLNHGAVKNMLAKAWGNPNDLQMADMGVNLFLFTFNSRDEALVVLHKSPWYVMGKLISLQIWNPHIAMYEILFSKVSFWIQLQDLPLEYFSVKNAGKILTHLGVILEIEDPTIDGKLIRPFIRARVELDIKLPLSTGCWVPRKNLPKAWVSIKYERLQDLCFKCGIIGHEQKVCTKERVMSTHGNNIHRYSHRVGVPPAKPLQMILAKQKRRKEYAQGHPSQSSRDQSWGRQQGHVPEDMRVTEEQLINRARMEYEEAMAVFEGDGEIPSGWEESREEVVYLPEPREEFQHYRPFVSGNAFFSNLRSQ